MSTEHFCFLLSQLIALYLLSSAYTLTPESEMERVKLLRAQIVGMRDILAIKDGAFACCVYFNWCYCCDSVGLLSNLDGNLQMRASL
jgi:hypothetical protein